LGFAAFVLLLYVVLFFLCSIVVVLSFFAIEVACRRRVTTDQPPTFYSHLVLPGAFVRLPGAPLYAFWCCHLTLQRLGRCLKGLRFYLEARDSHKILN
jgi:hypothetical protein